MGDDRLGSWRTPALLIIGVAYALGAATTTPFTLPADVVTAVPIAVFTVLVVWRWPGHPRARRPPGIRHPFRAWVVLVAAMVVWELIEYAARGSRGAHPTVSSMADAVDRSYGLKAIVFFAWLCLCGAIVCLGAEDAAAPAPEVDAP